MAFGSARINTNVTYAGTLHTEVSQRVIGIQWRINPQYKTPKIIPPQHDWIRPALELSRSTTQEVTGIRATKDGSKK